MTRQLSVTLHIETHDCLHLSDDRVNGKDGKREDVGQFVGRVRTSGRIFIHFRRSQAAPAFQLGN